jgi:hypothetical protein
MLRAPSSIWMPIIRGAIARSYSDPERGKRSAEMYLAPFAQGHGAKVLRKHLTDLDPAAIASIRDRSAQIKLPMFSSPPSPWRFMPEENPSETAAIISRALAADR